MLTQNAPLLWLILGIGATGYMIYRLIRATTAPPPSDALPWSDGGSPTLPHVLPPDS